MLLRMLDHDERAPGERRPDPQGGEPLPIQLVFHRQLRHHRDAEAGHDGALHGVGAVEGHRADGGEAVPVPPRQRLPVSRLGYDAAELAQLPPEVTSAFAGVGNPHTVAPLPAGARVLDVGSGSGTDLLVAALHVGPRGRAIGVDMTDEMRERAREGAARCGLDHVELRSGDATALPVEDASVGIVMSNGVLNLVPEKDRAIAEIARVLRPGGRVQIADIVLGQPLSEGARRDIDLWTG